LWPVVTRLERQAAQTDRLPQENTFHGSCGSDTFIHMRTLIVCLLAVGLGGMLGIIAQEKKAAPEKLTFTTKNGNVTFDHAAHLKRAKGDCSTCHETLFKQDAKAPLNFKAALHKTAETEKTSCGSCHHPAGPAFETKGNCAKCHVKG
jgi:c(7)-type cytochrome triheme protein